MKNFRDWYSVVQTAENKGMLKGRAEGREEGREEGRAEGREEEKLQIARNMKKRGVHPEDIMQFTGLSLKEVNAL